MRYDERWKIEKLLGKGGQGEVHLVLEILQDEAASIKTLFEKLQIATMGVSYADDRERTQKLVIDSLAELLHRSSNLRYGALKRLHREDQARDAKLASQRAADEIAAMNKWRHPNLLRMLDHDPEELWYVSEYFSRGTLNQYVVDFKGNVSKVLSTIRPLVTAVAELHRNGCVHRDIKPENIFVSDSAQLVLGDFGLIYLSNPEKTRLSEANQNVGSRDWMPGWAMSKRVDQLTPAFDVYSLGKVIWSMLSGESVLPLWYFDKDQYNVEKLFPADQNMAKANRLFSKCIVENERDCLPDASALVNAVDELLGEIYDGSPLQAFQSLRCQICAIGTYIDNAAMVNSAQPNIAEVRKCHCNHCGHLIEFRLNESSAPLKSESAELVSRFADVDLALETIANNFQSLWSHEVQQNRPTSDAPKFITERFRKELFDLVERYKTRLPEDVNSEILEARNMLESIRSSYRSLSKNRQDEFLSRISSIRSRLEVHSKLKQL